MDGPFFFLFMERRGVNFIYLLSDATNIKYVRILYQGRKYILLMWYHVTLDAKWYFTFIPRYWHHQLHSYVYSQMTPWWPTLFWNWLKILWLKLLWPRLKRICCSLNIPCDLGAARIDTKLKVINWLMIFWENIGLMYGIYIYCLLKRLS